MAITETTPAPADEQVNPWDTGEDIPAGAQILGAGDHKTLGRLWIGFALLFGVAAWALQALTSANLIGDGLVTTSAHGQVFTAGRIGLVLLFAVPLFIGIATYVVPLQVGANTVAFPRAAAAALWSWLLGSVLFIVAYAINGGISGARISGVDLALLATALTIAALLLATVCALTTLVAMRTPDMTLDRVPMFTWSVLVAGTMWLLTLPVLAGNLLLIYLDHHYGTPSEFGFANAQWPQVSWAFEQPQVFAYAIPVLGAILDIVTTAAGRRVPKRGILLAAVGAVGILSFGAWAQSFFNPGVQSQALFVGQGIAILVALVAVAGGVASIVRAGSRMRLDAAWIGAIGALLVLLLAGLASALFVIGPLELTKTPYFQDGVAALVIGAVTTGGIAALHHWAPKMWGRMANDNLGKLAVTLAVLGSLVAGLALCVRGFQVRFTGLASASDALNGVAAAGGVLLVLAVLVAVASLAAKGLAAHADPWGGQTLEWATSSPPPPGNFGTLPVVTSAEPLLDESFLSAGSSKEGAS